jgi:hypothetical protein
MLLFFRTGGKAGSPFHLAGTTLAIPAKRKGGQAIENKQFCEMVHFAPVMIPRTYDQRRETARFARRKDPFGGPSAARRLGTGAASRWNRSKRTRKWRRRLQPLGGRIDQANFVSIFFDIVQFGSVADDFVRPQIGEAERCVELVLPLPSFDQASALSRSRSGRSRSEPNPNASKNFLVVT